MPYDLALRHTGPTEVLGSPRMRPTWQNCGAQLVRTEAQPGVIWLCG